MCEEIMISPRIASVDSDLFRRVCGEFLEMPGLQLTCEQAMRLWGLGRGECSTLLDVLVNAHFLCHSRHGTFKRSADGPIQSPGAFVLSEGTLRPNGLVSQRALAKSAVDS